mgnify:CR=1 FL=1
MILSDTDLLRELEHGSLVVSPLDIDRQVQPASIDIKLGQDIIEFDRTGISCIHPDSEEEIDQYTTEKTIDEDGELILHPGDFILGSTKEWIEVPNHLVARIEGRSSLGRLAIIVHATAGWIDTGYKGRVTLELSNLGAAPVALTPGMRIGQMVVLELKSECTRPYGSGRDSKYQNQRGPEASQIQEDQEFN